MNRFYNVKAKARSRKMSKCKYNNTIAIVIAMLFVTWYPAHCADITVNGTVEYQTIDGFGTSIMNWMDSVYANAQNRTDFARDLGCSIVRGELHPAAITKDDCMDANPTTFGADIDANVGLMDFRNHYRLSITGEFMKAVYGQRLDDMKVTFSIWTPPHWLKENAVLSTEYGCQSYQGHLARTADNRTQFGRYVAAWLKGFSAVYGVPVYSLSVQNELDWAHDPSTWTTSCQYFSTKYPADRANGPALGQNDFNPAIDYAYRELHANGLGFIKLMGPEKSHILSDSWEMGVQLSYIEDMAANGTALSQIDILCYHGYESSATSRSLASSYWSEIGGYGKPSWQTEAGGEPVTWAGAMELASRMQNELVAGNVSAYLYWAYASDGTDELALKNNGTQKTDKYTAFKHFSRYIRPGAVRLACSPDSPTGLSASAYRHAANGTLTIVLVNNGSAQTANISVPSQPAGIASFTAYSSVSGSLWSQAVVAVNGSIVSVAVPASGIVTLYGTGSGTQATPDPTSAPTTVPTVAPTPAPTIPSCPCTIGDSNCSGQTDIIDALLAAQYYVGLAPATITVCAADTDRDGDVDIVDALRIAQCYVGIIQCVF